MSAKTKLILAVLLAWSVLTLAGQTSLATAAPAATTDPTSKRQKVIDFEDEVVEGLNKRPLDSLSQISEKEKRRRRMHLYRKRAGFRSETAETLRVLRYTP